MTSDQGTVPPRAEPPEELEEFVRVTQARLRAQARFLCQDGETAEDLVQEAYVQASRMWSRLRAMDHPEAYLREVMRNEFRRRGERRTREVASWLQAATPAQARIEMTVETREVLEAVRDLPERQREVLVRFCLQAEPQRAIAEDLKISVNTVAVHVKQARNSLAKRLRTTSQELWADFDALVDAPAGGLQDQLLVELLDASLWLEEAFEHDRLGLDLLLERLAEAWGQDAGRLG
ncbi:sigma-70 family RNA polymerase sigma factor [Kitasatospora sp. NPDC059648]|uniref:sigma-70 family RNA polymerase sigma factor n=1 Tax=Kitasatospora sp. NPDC059648 TaxID=3346894 RepID=UPI0036A4838D